VPVTRVTASVTHDAPLGERGNVATTFVWGQNWAEHHPTTPSFLLETNVELDGGHTPFARFEYVVKTGHDLVLGESLENEKFGIASATLGYVYDFAPVWSVVPGVGAALNFYAYDSDLADFYGRDTAFGGQVFVRFTAPRM